MSFPSMIDPTPSSVPAPGYITILDPTSWRRQLVWISQLAGHFCDCIAVGDYAPDNQETRQRLHLETSTSDSSTKPEHMSADNVVYTNNATSAPEADKLFLRTPGPQRTPLGPVHYQWPPAQQPQGGPRTPLNSIVSGPMAGGLWDAEDDAARSISECWFDLAYTPDVKPAMANLSGDAVLALLVGLLLQISDVSPRLSPIVKGAISRNEYPFLPRGPRPPQPAPRDALARMLTIHLRRGDYFVRCHNLASWNSTYYSWAQLPDRFPPLPNDDPERIKKMLTHYLPTIVQIVRKTQEDYVNVGLGRFLDVFYLLTNEQGPWLDEPKAKLKVAGWCTLVTIHLTSSSMRNKRA
ncbi:hypothetical protein K438DRAFT_1773626 [Mycena galopus ATCC 62051]|nr:hypothetical protein K438DRAFT_1773626 [Mycena galopus ATCC 62051]